MRIWSCCARFIRIIFFFRSVVIYGAAAAHRVFKSSLYTYGGERMRERVIVGRGGGSEIECALMCFYAAPVHAARRDETRCGCARWFWFEL